MHRLYGEESIVSWIEYAFPADNTYSRLVSNSPNICHVSLDCSKCHFSLLVACRILTDSCTLLIVCYPILVI